MRMMGREVFGRRRP